MNSYNLCLTLRCAVSISLFPVFHFLLHSSVSSLPCFSLPSPLTCLLPSLFFTSFSTHLSPPFSVFHFLLHSPVSSLLCFLLPSPLTCLLPSLFFTSFSTHLSPPFPVFHFLLHSSVSSLLCFSLPSPLTCLLPSLFFTSFSTHLPPPFPVFHFLLHSSVSSLPCFSLPSVFDSTLRPFLSSLSFSPPLPSPLNTPPFLSPLLWYYILYCTAFTKTLLASMHTMNAVCLFVLTCGVLKGTHCC